MAFLLQRIFLAILMPKRVKEFGKPGIGASKPVRWEGVGVLRYINYLVMSGIKGLGF